MRYLIADAHCDRLSSRSQAPDVSPERLAQGGVALQCFALFASIHMGEPYASAKRQLDALSALCEEDGSWPIRRTQTAFLPEDHTAALLTMEGGEILEGSFSRYEEFLEEGVRAIALTWNHENQIGYPARIDGDGLKPFGMDLVSRMRRDGIAIDVSHLSEKGFWDVEKRSGPFMATHSNAKALCGHFRNLTDDQIRAIIDHKGFIGINFYPLFLRDQATFAQIDDILRHIEHMLSLGAQDIIGFGSDYDGIETKPSGMEHAGCFPNLMQALEERGYPQPLLRAIAGENLVRFFGRMEGEKA